MGVILGVLAGAALGACGAWLLHRRRMRRHGRFLAFVAHELNTPVASLHMSGVNFMTGVFGDLPPDQRSWMALMMDQIARLDRLLGDFRDAVHLELLGDFTPASDRLDLGVFVSEAGEASRAEIERSGAELRIDIQKGPGPVRADPDGLRRAVHAVLDHARKFRRAGPISVSVTGAQAVVEYEGPPLTPEQARETLRLFEAADGSNTNIPTGTGLGLGLAREVLRACGGGLVFEVDREGRARIALSLPAAP